jgi:hypothetical protein
VSSASPAALDSRPRPAPAGAPNDPIDARLGAAATGAPDEALGARPDVAAAEAPNETRRAMQRIARLLGHRRAAAADRSSAGPGPRAADHGIDGPLAARESGEPPGGDGALRVSGSSAGETAADGMSTASVNPT